MVNIRQGIDDSGDAKRHNDTIHNVQSQSPSPDKEFKEEDEHITETPPTREVKELKTARSTRHESNSKGNQSSANTAAFQKKIQDLKSKYNRKASEYQELEEKCKDQQK